MPVSDEFNLPSIWAEAERIQPKGVIELGIGCGLVSAGLRNYLDGRWGRVKPEDWQVTLVGIEGFEAYSNPLWGALNSVTIADFSKSEVYESITGWDLVVIADSIEHIEKLKAQAILAYLVTHNKNVIVSVPLGDCPQNAVFNNIYEEHRSTWDGSEFDVYNCRVLHRGVCLVVALRGVKK